MTAMTAMRRQAAIEAALSPVQRAALAELCNLFAIPLDRWIAVGPLRQVFETAAAVRLAEELRINEGAAAEDARARAALRLEVSPDTIKTRLNRWPYAAVTGFQIEPNDRRRAT